MYIELIASSCLQVQVRFDDRRSTWLALANGEDSFPSQPAGPARQCQLSSTPFRRQNISHSINTFPGSYPPLQSIPSTQRRTRGW